MACESRLTVGPVDFASGVIWEDWGVCKEGLFGMLWDN